MPRGGPDGGDGGRGGSVYLRADPSVSTLLEFSNRRHFKAGRGGNGAGAKKHGKAGENVRILVPPGTVVMPDGELLADLSQPGDEVMVARGGRGGLGNVHFVDLHQPGPDRGPEGRARARSAALTLELKTIADVGLVGLPQRRQVQPAGGADGGHARRSGTTRSRRWSRTSGWPSATISRSCWPTSPA